MSKEFLCIYCQAGRVKKLPAKCLNCKRSLKLKIQKNTSLGKLVDRYFYNGLRLDFKNGGPGKGEITFRPVDGVG